jgi:hypothetical protein
MTLRSNLRSRSRRAFSLLELMVSVGLLTVIVVALYAMFDQVQKAFRSSLNQVEVTEGGRAALELLVRQVERAESPRVEDALSLVLRPADGRPFAISYASGEEQPLRFDEMFYYYRVQGDRWRAAGLFVGRSGSTNAFEEHDGLATVYLFDEALPARHLSDVYQDNGVLLAPPIDPRGTNLAPMSVRGTRTYLTNEFSGRLAVMAALPGSGEQGRNALKQARRDGVRVIDGVIQAKITAMDADGLPYQWDHPVGLFSNPPRASTRFTFDSNPQLRTNWTVWQNENRNRPRPIFLTGVNLPYSSPSGRADPTANRAVELQFRGTNFPSALEIELTLLDGKQLDQFRSLPATPPAARLRWLQNNGAALQTLRQRVHLRMAPQ